MVADFFKIVPGMKPVDPADLAEYERAMREEVIPEIIREVERRRILAMECRGLRIRGSVHPLAETQRG